MKKSTKIALGCALAGGAGTVACTVLAVHFWRRRQTGSVVACGVIGGCAAVVAAGAAVRSARRKETPLLEWREGQELTKLGDSADEQESFGHGNIHVSRLQVGHKVEDAEYVGEMKEKTVAWLDGNDKTSGIGKRRLAEWRLYLKGIYDENPYN